MSKLRIIITEEAMETYKRGYYWHVVTSPALHGDILINSYQHKVTGNWILGTWSWSVQVDCTGTKTCTENLLFYESDKPYPKASAAVKLEMIRNGLLPLDKLKQLSKPGGKES